MAAAVSAPVLNAVAVPEGEGVQLSAGMKLKEGADGPLCVIELGSACSGAGCAVGVGNDVEGVESGADDSVELSVHPQCCSPSG
jgi:hypothetical protein